MIDDLKNQEQIQNAEGQVRGERIDQKDLELIYFDSLRNSYFGAGDTIEMAVYDTEGNLLYWENLAENYDLLEQTSPVIDPQGVRRLRLLPGKFLRPVGFSRGLYRVSFAFLQDALGSSSGNKVFIDEISPSRTEIRILPAKTGNADIDAAFSDYFGDFKVVSPKLYTTFFNQLANIVKYNQGDDADVLSEIAQAPPKELGTAINPNAWQSEVFPELENFANDAFTPHIFPQIGTRAFAQFAGNPLATTFSMERAIKNLLYKMTDSYLKNVAKITDESKLIYPYLRLRFGKLIDKLLEKVMVPEVNQIFELNLRANFGNDVVIPITAIVRDDVAFPKPPHSLVLKLYDPLPDDIDEKTKLWISKELSEPVVEKVYLLGTETERIDGYLLSGPNFDIDVDYTSNRATEYQTWDEILSTHPTSSVNLIGKYLSGSLLEGIDINIDFEDYSNFVLFGSAEERLANFKYKMELVETYESQINTLDNVSGSESRSLNVLSGSLAYQSKKRAILDTFDSYEYHLYYSSGSIYSSSVAPTESVLYNPIGEWPKQNSTYPYTLYSYTSSQVTSWYATQSSIAQDYDNQNESALVDNLPFHILFDEKNDAFITFMHMMGQYFDVFYTYTKALSKLSNRDHDVEGGLAKDLTFHVAKSFGFDLENGNDYVELWKYAFGTDVSGTLLQTQITGSGADSGSGATITTETLKSQPYGDITKEIWRRLLINLPYLMKTKGTERSIRALLSCYGIPRSIVAIREYGGPDPRDYADLQDKSYFAFDNFVYALDFDGGQYVSEPWNDFDSFSEKPKTLELRFKATYTGATTQSLVNVDDHWGISLYRRGLSPYRRRPDKSTPTQIREGKLVFSSSAAGAISSSDFGFFDGNWYSVILTTTTDHSHSLYVKRADDSRIIYQSSASMPSASNYEDDGTLYLGGDGVNFGDQFSGSMMEFRLFQPALSESVFDNHVRWPKSYNSNGVTGSYADLVLRWALDEPKNQNADTTVSDVRPNQNTTYPGTANGFANEINYSSVTEEYWALTPQTGMSRYNNNKIRIEKNEVISGTLSLENSVQKSAFDLAPLDSNRLGVFFTPIDAINEDMIATFAGEDLTGYIGDPRDLYEAEYDDLRELQTFYWQKYIGRYINFNEYLRILSYYDKSLFDQLKALIPARVELNVGTLLEPNVLERYKVKHFPPVYSEHHYSSSIELGDGRIKEITGSATFLTSSAPTLLTLLTASSAYNDSTLYATASDTYVSGSYGYIPPIEEYLTGSALESYRQVFARTPYFGYDLKYGGVKQTADTTLDGRDPVEIRISNPNRLKTTDEGPSKLKIE